MKRFMVFAFASYYPAGGWNDFQGSFDTAQEAMDNVNSGPDWDYFQIIDAMTGEDMPVRYIGGAVRYVLVPVEPDCSVGGLEAEK